VTSVFNFADALAAIVSIGVAIEALARIFNPVAKGSPHTFNVVSKKTKTKLQQTSTRPRYYYYYYYYYYTKLN